MSPNVLLEIAELQDKTVSQLVQRYEQVFEEECRSRNKQYLIRRIAWRLQANEEGGLSRAALKKAEELAIGAETRVTAPKPSSKLPRITRLMALAIQFNEMIRTGEASDMIELARLGHVTQPRMSQIMALNQLAPDIQEALLNLPATKGKPEIHEKRLRPIAAMLNWEEQRAAWKCICDGL